MAGELIGYDYNGNPIYSGGTGSPATVDRTGTEDRLPAGGANTTQTQTVRPPSTSWRSGQPVTDGSGKTWLYYNGSYYDPATGNANIGPQKAAELEATRSGAGGVPGVTPPTVTAPPATALPSQSRVVAPPANPFGGTGQPVAPARTAPAGRTPGTPPVTAGGYGIDTSRITDPRAPAASGTETTSGLAGLLSTYGMQLPTFAPDYDRYLKPAEDVFRGELERLSQADPFGNQAFLQKATDRGVAESRAVAAGARGGAGAVGGAFRQSQGVQSQLAAQGAQEMTQLKAQDARQAQGLRLQAAQGLGGLATTGAGLAVEAEKGKVQAFSAGIDAILRSEQLSQQDRQFYETLNFQWSSLDEQAQKRITDAAVAYTQIDQQRYATDVNYRQSVDQNIVQRYSIDKNFEANMKQIAQSGKLTFRDVFLGTLSAGGAVAAGIASKP